MKSKVVEHTTRDIFALYAESTMRNIRALPDLSLYVCGRNPIATWAVERLLAGDSSSQTVHTWLPHQLMIVPRGIQILLIDVSSISEWPEISRKWAAAGHRVILLVVETWGSKGRELRALHLGARGIVYVTGDFVRQLLEAIHLVANGQLFARKESLDEFYGRHRCLRSGSTAPYLSFREEQVIDLLMEGFSNKRIGTVLGISERTAKFHVSNILHKLQLTNRRELVHKDRNVVEQETTA